MKHITIAGIFLCSLVCAQAYASIYEGKVVGVTDVDTLNGPDRPTAARSGAPLPAASLPRALRRASAANGEDVRCGCSFSHHRADAGISAVPDADISASADMSAERLRHRLVSLANTHSDQSVKPCSVQRLG